MHPKPRRSEFFRHSIAKIWQGEGPTLSWTASHSSVCNPNRFSVAMGQASGYRNGAGVVMTSGVAWIREQDYRWARRRMIDGYLFPPAYQDWTATAEAELRRCMASGHVVRENHNRTKPIRGVVSPAGAPNAQLCQNAFRRRGGTALASRAGALILLRS
jgi:hypothetical protein